jgi:hypothetical protein
LTPPADACTVKHQHCAERTNTENPREAIKALDADRTELVKNTIENIKPGKPFDSGRTGLGSSCQKHHAPGVEHDSLIFKCSLS